MGSILAILKASSTGKKLFLLELKIPSASAKWLNRTIAKNVILEKNL
jgi:hypothetical protein